MRDLHVGAVAFLAVSLLAIGCSGADEPTSDTAPAVDPSPSLADQPRPETVLDLSGDTSTEWPIGGLLAIALTPDAGHLLTLQNSIDGTVTLKAFPYSSNQPLTPADGRVVMRLDHPYVHSGGGLVVDPNGDVLVGIGAFRRPGEPLGTQNPDGSVIRVPASAVVDDTAATFPPTTGDVVARGLRQPWRITFDRETGDLWIADVGERVEEEIDVIRAAALDGPPPNFGWPYLEGSSPFIEPPPADVEFEDPYWNQPRQDMAANIIGGYVYRGNAIPELNGSYVFTDFNDGTIMALPADGSSAEAEEVGAIDARPTSFGEDTDGELLILTASGMIHRLERASESTGSTVTTRPIANIWEFPPSDAASEATSLISEPGGTALLASERGGLITRIDLDADPRAVCPLTFSQLPQLAYLSPGEIEDAVTETLQLLDRHGDQLPPQLAPELYAMSTAYEAMDMVGSTTGWDSPEFRRLILETSVERGEFADAQRAESSIANHVTAVCS